MKLTGQRNQCPTCNLYFNSNSAFDKHRVGAYSPIRKRRCLSEDEMMWVGMIPGNDGFWRGSEMPKGRTFADNEAETA